MGGARHLTRGGLLAGALAAALAGLTPAAASAGLTFASTGFAAGSDPEAVAVGDFNEDGARDVAAANAGSDTVSVLLGTGTGSLSSAHAFVTAQTPKALAVADFDRDGHQDLAATGLEGDGSVSILRGTGTGSFGTPTTFPVAEFPTSIAVADLNADGKQDLAVAAWGSTSAAGSVSVLLGTGTGSFTNAGSLPTGTLPASVAAGDFDGDGHADLAVANEGQSNGAGADVAVLLGNGTGTFGAASHFAAGANPEALGVGDLDGDDALDLAVASLGSGKVAVLKGSGLGSFAPPSYLAVGTSMSSLAVDNFDGDGWPDLAVAGGGSVSVLRGTGGGAFAAAVSFLSPSVGIASGDFNGDGMEDVAGAGGGSNSVSLLRNAPTADVSPGALAFASVRGAGKVTAPQTVTIRNDGLAPLTVSGYAVSGVGAGDYFAGTDTCRSKVAPGASCTLQVRYVPQTAGSSQAALTVLSDAAGSTSLTLQGEASFAQGTATTAGGTTAVRGHNATARIVLRLRLNFAGRARATLTRRGITYATGRAAAGRVTLRARRPVPAGRYRLELRRAARVSEVHLIGVRRRPDVGSVIPSP
jgi:hypothetical protein